MNKFSFLIATAFVLHCAGYAFACDPCALYSATQTQGLSDSQFRLSVAEQYTSYDKGDNFKDNSLRDGEIVKGFSTTQIALAYDLAERWGIQAVIPIVSRRFERIERYRKSTDSDTGIGDASLIGYYSLISERHAESATIWNVFSGVKFPTGDTGSISQSLGNSSEEASHTRHHTLSSAGGGRVLALGTGSYDYPVGSNVFYQKDRFFLLGTAQYTFRTEGDFDYRFDNDFLWNVGPGGYIVLEHDYSIAARLAVSGEHKGRDKQKGQSIEDSEVKNIYVGPEVLFTWNNIAGEIGTDFVAYTDDSSAAVVPEFRVRSALSYRF